MSHNLQDILAAASGYQSVTSEPALNRKRPKTLDDYPVMPPASKKRVCDFKRPDTPYRF